MRSIDLIGCYIFDWKENIPYAGYPVWEIKVVDAEVCGMSGYHDYGPAHVDSSIQTDQVNASPRPHSTAYLSTVFVGAQSLNQLTSNKDIRILLNRLRRQAAMGAASPAASGSDPFAFSGFQDYLFSVFSNDPLPNDTLTTVTLPPDILSPQEALQAQGDMQQSTQAPQVVGLTTTTEATTTTTTTVPTTTTTTPPPTTTDRFYYNIGPYLGPPGQQLPPGFSQPYFPQYMPPSGMGQMWMDPPDGLPFYMMSSYMRGGAYPQTMGMPYPGMRYHDGIPGRLADGSDAAQQMYRNTGPGGRRRTRRPAALRTINALQGGPPNRQQRPPPQPSPSQYMPPTGRLPPPPPSPRSPPPSPRGSAPAQGIYYMAPDLIRAGLPAMLSPAKARIVGPMIKQMRAMRRTPDQISDQIGDVLMV